MSDKPDCYACVHRREVPGSAHSACAHPSTKDVHAEPFAQLAGRVGKRGGDQLMAMADAFGNGAASAMRALHIEGHPHGVRMGWFVWPVNFDPTWLAHCDGFSARDEGTAS